MKALSIKRLVSGGLITNYYCSSRCRHCLYACSPSWEKKYVDRQTAERLFAGIRALGCPVVHIGGGEPFLNPEGLLDVLNAARSAGMGIEYVETNSSWYDEPAAAADLLVRFREAGMSTLLVSISPFHNEFVPLKKIKGVIAACKASGVTMFPWIQAFYADLNAFPDLKVHSLEEYAKKFGPDYVRKIPSRYWIHQGGRALLTYSELSPLQPTEKILEESGRCSELSDTSHFHVDLFGRYIPGLCSGFSIRIEDLGRPLDSEAYPLICTLFGEGVSGFLDLASEQYGFKAGPSYLSKCHLCLEIRRFLVLKKKIKSPELEPAEFYSQL